VDADVQLWDMSGPERFGNLTRLDYQEVVELMIVSNVARIRTREVALLWKIGH
jgi:hypothetical protein